MSALWHLLLAMLVTAPPDYEPPFEIPTGYLDLAAVHGELDAIAAEAPTVAEVVDLTALLDTPPTAQGRHLFALHLSSGGATPFPPVLITAAIHPAEVMTPLVALTFGRLVATSAGTDSAPASLLAERDVWIVPVVNPDGYVRVWETALFWRKNLTPYDGGEGVDLNRNYPVGWSGTCSGDDDPSSEWYKGPSPGSEPETQTIMALATEQGFDWVVDLHTAGRTVLVDCPCGTCEPSTELSAAGMELAGLLGYSKGIGTSNTEGQAFQWHMEAMGSKALLLEMASSHLPPYQEALDEATLVANALVGLVSPSEAISLDPSGDGDDLPPASSSCSTEPGHGGGAPWAALVLLGVALLAVRGRSRA